MPPDVAVRPAEAMLLTGVLPIVALLGIRALTVITQSPGVEPVPATTLPPVQESDDAPCAAVNVPPEQPAPNADPLSKTICAPEPAVGRLSVRDIVAAAPDQL